MCTCVRSPLTLSIAAAVRSRGGGSASTPEAVEGWVSRWAGREVHVAMEACTGWLFVARAVQRAGGIAHLAETVETRALRGRKRRAKTDRQDALWLRELLAEGRLPEAWIAPEHVRGWRSRLHLRKALIDERTQWLLRIRSVLYHHGLSAGAPGEISSPPPARSSTRSSSRSTRVNGSRSRC